MNNKGFVVLFVLLATAVCFPASEDNSIRLTEKSAFTYAYMSFSGPFSTMPQKIMAFMAEFFKQGLQPAGTMISVYHNSPATVEESELKWDIGFPVSSDIRVKPPLNVTVYTKKTVLEYIHRGSYDLLPAAYQKLTDYVEAKKFKIILPTYEFYLNSPQQVKVEELKTRIEIPIIKKESP
jgi:effector-binding domain-containing protein